MSNLRIVRSAIQALLGLAVQPALATVTVQYDQSSSYTSAIVTQSQTTGRWTVTCNANYLQGPTTFWILCTDSDDFDSITINANVSSQQARVYVASQNSLTSTGDLSYLSRGGSGAVVILGLNVSGTVGNILVNSIDSAVINGSVTGSINLPNSDVLAQCSLRDTHVHGNLYGNVGVPAGTILGLQVDGDIGSAQAPSTITVRDNIYLLEAQNIYATVDANTEPGHWIGTFHTRGDFKGTLNARAFAKNSESQQRFWIDGDLDADVLLSERIYDYNTANGESEVRVGGVFRPGHVLRTGYELRGTTGIAFAQANALQGCLILNSLNSGYTWAGEVKVDGITLSPTSHGAPYYDVASSALGGGAVGLVPYHLYVNDCSPVSSGSPGPTLFDSALNQRFNGQHPNANIRLRFYGPVFAVPDTTRPVRIEYNIGSSWIDISHHFYINVESTAASTSREVEIHGGNGEAAFMPGEYRISPVAGRLKCAQTTAASAPDVSDSMYYFNVDADCNLNYTSDSVDLAVVVDGVHPFDRDNNGCIDSCEHLGWWCLADVNYDGFVNADDYDLFVWFFDNGLSLADYNLDGFVNGADYDDFVEDFDLGGNC